jgi:hypothetical protein
VDLARSLTAAAQYGFDPGNTRGGHDSFELRIHFWKPSAKFA